MTYEESSVFPGPVIPLPLLSTNRTDTSLSCAREATPIHLERFFDKNLKDSGW
jgi:hypothetical protein